ncbi:MAG: pectate lyase [Candidatus Latescibacterota bacterium]
MHFRSRLTFAAVALSTALLIPAVPSAQRKAPLPDPKQQALATMRKASDFMMNTVSTRGGFLWQYSADLSERWGEVPARPSQIWVQGATNDMGELFLEAWRATGDSTYLAYACRVADAIVAGQYPAGGWHYFIDFDMPGIQKYYDEIASKCWGWEEYYHYYGNCTFDDDSTTSAAQFLLHVYLETLNPAYRAPLLKALDFILEAQYPLGGWPQRYPLSYEFPHHGIPDYTHYYTYNDGVIPNIIFLLVEAWEKLGDERYYEAARRGMDFYLAAQGPEDQAGWSSQFDMSLQPAQSRSYEPKSYSTQITVLSIRELETFYKITGDRRYLRPIPAAIAWLERSIINTDPAKNYTHGRFLEVGTNRPLVAHREGTNIENGRYWIDYDLDGPISGMAMVMRFDVPAIKREYERVKALAPEQAKAEYSASRAGRSRPGKLDPGRVKTLAASLDSRGAWITDIHIPNYTFPPHDTAREIKGISTATFISNMRALMNAVRSER